MNKILLGDCLELLPTIADKSIDMILCDLPYGTTDCEWDSIIDMGRLWQEYERVIKDNGAIVLTANAKFTILLGASNLKLFRYKWVWVKSKKLRFLNANKMPLTQHEDVLVFYKTLPTYNPIKIKTRAGGGVKRKPGTYSAVHSSKIEQLEIIDDGYSFPSDIIEIDNPNHNSIHPTQKPVVLFEYLIKTYTNEGDLVLDNCSGSGTTAIACINTNRRYICMERDEGYYQKSVERVANHEPLLQFINQKS
jgi:site-specific DNA-methyltransferase (adenine-specific)